MEKQASYETDNLPANVGDKSLAENEKQVPMIKNNFEEELNKMISMAGTIELTESQKEILYAPVDDDLIEIRPDGMIYLPWMEYVSRLKQTFGLSWQAIPQGMPKFQGNHLYWGYYLVIGGKFAGFAIGEQEYQVKNYGMSYGDAVEGAKSNALMRLCKGIGICLELWQPSFIKRWKAEYAETYYNKEKQKTYWRRKELQDIPEEQRIEPSETEQEAKDKASKEEQEAKDKAKKGFLEKLMVDLNALQTIPELENKYRVNKASYENSELKPSILSMYASRKKQLTLDLLASQTGFSAFQIDAYMEQAGDIATLITEVIAGNAEAIIQLKTDISAYQEESGRQHPDDLLPESTNDEFISE